ncbi:MAG: DUF881 domain-containing protein [Dermatophilaceae bacterium]
MSQGPAGRPDESMTLITEMMQRPLDPGYAAAADSRAKSGLPASTGHHSPMLVLVAVLIGALLAISALALRVPETSASKVKTYLVGRIEAMRGHAEAQTRVIATVRSEIDTAQAAALSRQSQTLLAEELSRLELAAGTVPVTGPGLVLTVDDAPADVGRKNPNVDPRAAAGPDEGKVIARDLQIIVNGLWQAGAEAISVNGHRLTSRAAIRFAGEAILVDYRPLTRPYVITAIGQPGGLSVEFAGNDGGSYLQSLKANYRIRGDIKERDSVVVPGEPALSLQEARPVRSAVTRQTPVPTAAHPATTGTTTAPKTRTGTQTTEAPP